MTWEKFTLGLHLLYIRETEGLQRGLREVFEVTVGNNEERMG